MEHHWDGSFDGVDSLLQLNGRILEDYPHAPENVPERKIGTVLLM
jgi:hypothetical protein